MRHALDMAILLSIENEMSVRTVLCLCMYTVARSSVCALTSDRNMYYSTRR